jgi:hypothetical protein
LFDRKVLKHFADILGRETVFDSLTNYAIDEYDVVLRHELSPSTLAAMRMLHLGSVFKSRETGKKLWTVDR